MDQLNLPVYIGGSDTNSSRHSKNGKPRVCKRVRRWEMIPLGRGDDIDPYKEVLDARDIERLRRVGMSGPTQDEWMATASTSLTNITCWRPPFKPVPPPKQKVTGAKMNKQIDKGAAAKQETAENLRDQIAHECFMCQETLKNGNLADFHLRLGMIYGLTQRLYEANAREDRGE